MGWAEIAVVLIVGLVVFGPDRLPHMAKQAGAFVRQVRQMAENARNDLGQELGHDLDFAELDPRTAVRRALFDEPATKHVSGPLPGAVAGTPTGPTAPFDAEAT